MKCIMQTKTKRHIRRWSIAVLLYVLLWTFLWGFLAVRTASYNRLSHDPVVMAQLTVTEDTATLSLAEQTTTWTCSGDVDRWYFWIATLPTTAADWAIQTWRMLMKSQN